MNGAAPWLTVEGDLLQSLAMFARIGVSVCALLVLALGSAAVAAPRAELVPNTWDLDLEFHDPQRISLRLPGDEHVTTFWYLLYRVSNRTGHDVEFYPSFRLVTNTLKTVTGGDHISPSVYEAIAARHAKEFPFFAVPSKITGLLLQGEENARSSAAVFRVFDPKASRFTVYVAGLSGDITRVKNPKRRGSRQGEDEPPFLLRRSLAIVYDLAGDPETRKLANPVRVSRKWVMQ